MDWRYAGVSRWKRVALYDELDRYLITGKAEPKLKKKLILG
jgi:hypothetical protein